MSKNIIRNKMRKNISTNSRRIKNEIKKEN
jgi:hypothetical protein